MSDGRVITLACLDMAGTTVADEGAVEDAFLDALASMGIGADDERRATMLDYVRETMGTSKITVFRALFAEERTAQAANSAFEEAYAANLAGGSAAPIPGAVEAINRLRADGVRVALLTGFSAATRDRLVQALGWQELVDTLVCPAEAGRGRPYPDMVLKAALVVGVDDVRDIVVVGDTAADIASGLASGASRVIGVTSGADSAERLHGAGATDVLSSIAELPELIGH